MIVRRDDNRVLLFHLTVVVFMSRIGILTYHNNENRGAILQAYALSHALETAFDVTAEVIEYRSKSKEWIRKRSVLINRHPSQILNYFRDHRVVERFFSSELPTGRNSIITNDQKKAVAWLKNQNYDAIVTGSDEVWKIKPDNKTVIHALLSPPRPFPNLYFLDPDISTLTFSYAASANTTNLSALDADTIDTFRQHLDAYDHISVRDRHTKQLVEELGVENAHLVPDPTLMTELPTREVTSLLEQRGVDLDQPIVGFHGSDNATFKKICEQYRDRGYQVVATTASRFADVNLKGLLDPLEYYSAYQHFDMVVTSSLHSTIFSLKHGVPFATIDTKSIYGNIESKTYSLLTDFDMLDRHIDAVDGDASKFYENRDALEQRPDSDHIQARIDSLQERGYAFLDQVKADL